MTIQFANVEWREGNDGALQPYSRDFNDIYFQTGNGTFETDYVFIDGNQLKTRFLTLRKPYFCIFETGFGTGLNFFAVAELWLKIAPAGSKLRFISVEKLPMLLHDIQKVAEISHFSDLAAVLFSQYTSLKTGLNTFTLANQSIELHLYIDDIANVLPNLQVTDDNMVNAWLLDGFAPSKNPEMWVIDVLQHMARLSTKNTTFATFTSAGKVRRLLAEIGFTVEKLPGFGKKREMLAGYFVG